MDSLMLDQNSASYQTLKVRLDNDIAFIQFHRPEANNAINDVLIGEFSAALDRLQTSAKVIVLEGSEEVFCFGADFADIQARVDSGNATEADDPEPLYHLWLQLAQGPFISIAHVRGKANAGGIGFVAACDLVLAEEAAQFSLSELLFGLMPACVLPFLVRRMGHSKANLLTLMTQPISASQALDWGLVDLMEANSQNLLRKQLLRLRRLDNHAIARYKRYMNQLDDSLNTAKPKALAANQEVFSDQNTLAKIARYVQTGKFPWEDEH